MNLFRILEQAAATSNGIVIYPPGNTNQPPERLSYSALLQSSVQKARVLRRFKRTRIPTTILIHLENHEENIMWFWAVITAGCIPVISTPFIDDLKQRRKHLLHLQTTLNVPVILTQKSLFSTFLGTRGLNIQAVEDLNSAAETEEPEIENVSQVSTSELYNYWIRGNIKTLQQSWSGADAKDNDTAVFMLTSGSTGQAKAVCFTHGQIIAALRGKATYHETSERTVFLNWIGMDHVANLTEIHLHAMLLGADQVHVAATDVLVDPLVFLKLLSHHQVGYTFAPNFFLAAIRTALDSSLTAKQNLDENENDGRILQDIDLSKLQALISGGEANVVETCHALTQHLATFGAPDQVIRPGFGMTETCAGAIYSKDCPSYELARELDFSSLGLCIPGIEMRIVADDGSIAAEGHIGELQVTGDVVFKKYLNNEEATTASFTHDGWFKTGDRAFIDSSGYLNLAGRAKESIIINGVKCYPHQIETAVEEERLDGVKPSYIACFACRLQTSQTETFCIFYCPTYDPLETAKRVEISDRISNLSASICGARPFTVLPVDESHFQKSSLGKLSRSRFRTDFEAGVYDGLKEENDRLLNSYRFEQRKARRTTRMEELIMAILRGLSAPDSVNVDVHTNLFEAGMTSIDLLRLKATLQRELLVADIPLIIMLTKTTVETLASALEGLTTPNAGHENPTYDPVVALNTSGTGCPLWLVHPGVGEVLVFLSLAKRITGRPVYALRARGFEQDEEFFDNINETVDVYCHHLKRVQPSGPYAIAGYSFGAMLAFEMGKRLEAQSDEVAFLGSFNLPPHIKLRMQQLDWIEVALNLGSFLGFYTEDYVLSASPEMHKQTNHEVLDHIITKAPQNRFQELSLTRVKLERWISLAYAMQNAARDYEPSGSVAGMDIFYCQPLASVSGSKEAWLEEHLMKWNDFSRSEVRMHEVNGAHYTMLDPENVGSFQATLAAALAERNL